MLSTGYNGVAAGAPHCSGGNPCPGADLPPGVGHDLCAAVHAEANALLQCRDVDAVETAYCTHEPCAACAKLLLNSGCRRVLYMKPHVSSGRAQWLLAGRLEADWVYFPLKTQEKGSYSCFGPA